MPSIHHATLALLATLAAGSVAHAAQPGDRRMATLDVTVSYAGQGAFRKGVEHGTRILDRKLSYRIPLVGHYGPASGFAEWDRGLESQVAAPLPAQQPSKAGVADIMAAFEAAEAACGEDEACIANAIRGDAKAMSAASQVKVPASLPKPGAAPDFTRFIAFGPDCAKAVATASIADRHDESRIEGSEGGSGINRQVFTVTATSTSRGSDTGQACQVSAALDTRTNRYALYLPIEASLLAKPSNAPGAPYAYQLTETNGSRKLAARTRWLDLAAAPGGKSLAGRRVLENVNDAGANGTPVRATIDWKISLD